MVVTTINKGLDTVNCWIGGNKKEYIVHHDVGIKGQTAKNNIDYFRGGYRGASAHYFVDRTSIWQLIDDNNRAWHVGDDLDESDDPISNHNSIGIEMIVEKDGTIHPETKANAKWLTQYLMKKYGIPKSHNVRHFDASGKNCPQFLNKDGKWTEWKEYLKYVTEEEPKKVMITGKPSKRQKIRVFWFSPKSKFLTQLTDFLKESKMNYKEVTREDGKIKIEVFWFTQSSSNKKKVVKFLEDYGYNHDITLES